MSFYLVKENARARKLWRAILIVLCFVALAAAGAPLTGGRVSVRAKRPAAPVQGAGTTPARHDWQLKTERVNGREAIAGEVIVHFRDAVATPAVAAAPAEKLRAWREQLAAVEQELDVDHNEEIGLIGSRLVHSRTKTAAALVAALAAHADVEYAEPNYVVRPTAVPNDPQYAQQYGLPKIGAPAAWDVDLNRGSAANVVGVVDTGIDYTHPDLAANVWTAPAAFTVIVGGQTINCAAGTHGFNALTSTCDPLDDDAVSSHGTHVAGIIGAVGNNATGVAGVNWNAAIMGLKFIDAGGAGDIAHAINALTFAIQVKVAFAATGAANVRVLNNSWGPTENCPTCGFSQELLNTINAANTNQMLFVASAGNGGVNGANNNDAVGYYPASYGVPPSAPLPTPVPAPNVVAVAATDQNDNFASLANSSGFNSNFGATSVHIAAPGVAIRSTTRNNLYTALSGTSQAAAYFSGAAALVLSRCSALDTGLLKSTLLDNADPLASLNGKTQPGRLANTGRRLNVGAAITACAAAYPQTTATPTNVADAYVSRVTPTTNFGSATELQVKLTTVGDDSHDRQAYLKFDLSSLPAQIANARLRLFGSMSGASVASAPISVEKVTDTGWLEGTINWNNQPSDIPAQILATTTVTGTTAQFYYFDLTNFIQTEKAAGRNTISLRLVSTQATGGDDTLYARFNSKEAASNPPQLVVTTPAPCLSAPSGLVAWYAGDGNANDIQSSNNGTLKNGATFTLGKIGQAFSLDGVNDYVEGPINNVVSGAMSINAWVRQETVDGTIVSKYNSSAHHVSWGLYYQNGGRLRFIVSQNGDNVHRFADTVNVVSTPGVYKHVAATFNASTQAIKIYIDGAEVPVTTSGSANAIFNSSTNVRIGSVIFSEGVITNFFKGNIDEVQIHNRDLTAADIQNIYNAGSAGACKPTFGCAPPPSLAAWFPGEGNGFDIQGGNNATLLNGMTYTLGQVGQGFSLDGVNDYAEAPTNNVVTGPMSITAWVRQDTMAGTIISKYNSNASHISWALYYTSGGLRFVVSQNGNNPRFVDTVNVVSTPGVFRHVAATFDANAATQRMKIYVDGQEVPVSLGAGSPIVTSIFNSGTNVRIGTFIDSSGGPVNFFDGILDEVQLYSRELSAAEIQNIYSTGSSGLCHNCTPPGSGLVGWYSGDGSASDLASGNTGTLQNATFTSGEVGQAFSFAQNSAGVVIANTTNNISPVNLQLQNFTLDAWIQRASATQVAVVAANGDGFVFAHGQNGYGLGLQSDGSLFLAKVGVSRVSSGSLRVTDTNFHHVAVTKSGSVVFFYVDGVVNNTSAYDPGFTFTTPAAIGERADIQQNGFFGSLDEVQIYNHALTATEIQAIYNAGSSGNCKVLAPGNDNFANAQLLRGSAGSLTASNVLATKELGEPAHAGNAGGASIWYKWQAPASGTVTFTTAKYRLGDPQSTFDTLLAVYVGASVDTLTLIAGNDDAVSSAFTSSVTFNAVAGNTYYIAVDGFNNQTGAVALSWDYVAQFTVLDRSPNNNIANAQGLSGSTGTVSGTNVFADKEIVLQTREPDHANNAGGASVWYRWTAPAAGPVTFTTAGSTFDTLLAAYTLDATNTPAIDHLIRPALASNDDVAGGGGTLTSSITFSAAAGTAYYIAVDGAGNGRADGARNGKIVLTWRSQLSISGRIVGGGAGLPSVHVRLSGKNAQASDVAREVLTDGAGFYTISNIPAGGTYRVTPSRPTTDFISVNAPALPYIDFNNLSADASNANFRATSLGTNTVTVAGKLKNNSGGAISGVTVTLSGMTQGAPFTRTDVSGGEVGAYILPGIPAGSYTITPVSPVYTFCVTNINPCQSSLPFTGASDTLAADFTANQSLSISGQARAFDNTPLGAVTITLTSAGQPNVQTQTGADGFYTLPVAAGGNYTVTATKSGFTFNTLSPYNNVTANVKNADFVAAVPLTISGVVRNVNQRALNNITVNLSGDSTASRQTDNSGAYSFTVQAGGTYEVKPSDPRVTDWLPKNSVRYENLTQNVSNANFEARFPTFTVSGSVKTSGGTPLPGAIVKNGSREYVTNSSGIYTSDLLTILGDYSFIPQPFTHQTMPFGTRYNSFNPSGREFFSMTSDVLGLDFTASPAINVSTSAATSITSTSATINGVVNPNGVAANAWFFWGSESAPNTNQTSQQAIGAVTTAQPLTVNLTGLTASTTYYFRAVGTSSAGTGQGTLLSFITSAPSGPTIFTEEGTNRAIAIDSVNHLRGPFRVLTPFNFSSDRHTRVMLFTSNFTLNAGDALTVTVQGNLLPIENVGTLPGVNSASFIVVRLVDQLLPGEAAVVVTLRGMTSNTATITISP